MAEEKKDSEAAPAEGAAAQKSSKKKTIIIAAVAVVVLLLAAGIPLTIMLLKPKQEVVNLAAVDAAHPEDDAAIAEGADDEDQLDEGDEILGAVFPLDTFVVNLHGGRYLRCQLQLEFVEREIPKRFYSKLVPIRDGILGILSSRNADDALADRGRDTIKVDVKEMVNGLLRKEDVKRVYITQFVVQ